MSFQFYYTQPQPLLLDANEMKILVDDKEVFSSGKVKSTGYEAKALDIPVKDARKLTLLVTDADGNGGGDHASWGDAYLK